MKNTTEKRIGKFEFTPEVFEKVKECVFKKMPNYKIAQFIGLDENSFRYHLSNNTAELRTKIRAYEIDFMIAEAERVSHEILNVDAYNGGKRVDGKVLEVKQKEAAFLREKLVKAREVYDTKTNQVVNIVAPQPILSGLLDEITEVKPENEKPGE